MIINKILLTNYRNYETADVHFHPAFNVIVGNNGMGKTNLVDAIHYLALTKSNFSSGERFVIKQNSDFMRIQGEFSDPNEERPINITVKVKRNGIKVFSKDETDYERLSAHIGLIPLVIIAPKDILLILEGSSERRRFLDKSLIQCDLTYLRSLNRYVKLIKQRDAYLKSCQQSGYNETYLQSLDAQIPEPANYIYQFRKSFVEQLTALFNKIYNEISGDQEKMSLKYKSTLDKKPIEDILKLNRKKDLILARTTEGVHKDDLIFEMNGDVMKYFASQGQQKSLIYAIKLAQYQYLKNQNKSLPILILDDVFDKLDPLRVSRLIKQLDTGNYGQIFMTDTDDKRLDNIMNQLELDFVKFTVDNAQITIGE